MRTGENKRDVINAQSGRFSQRIGSTVFSVNVHFKEESQETLEEKILRLIKRDLEFGSNRVRNDLRKSGLGAIISLPQADWLPERGVL